MSQESIFKFAENEYRPVGGVHEVQDWAYVRSLVRAAIRGEKIAPYVECYSGTHRAAANDLLEKLGHDRLISTVDLDSDANEIERWFFETLIENMDYFYADLWIQKVTGYCPMRGTMDNCSRYHNDITAVDSTESQKETASRCLIILDEKFKKFLNKENIQHPQEKITTKIAI